MRSSFAFVLGALGLAALSGCSVSTTDNSITFKTQPEYVDSTQPAKSSSKAWAGEPIQINSDGIQVAGGTSGITVVVDPSATNVKVQADFVARADTEAEGKLSIADAIQTFSLDESNGQITINCKHGASHGSSSAANSGCKRMTVTIPAGSASQPHKLTVGLGNGDIKFSGAPTVANLLVDNNGSGDVDVSAVAAKGSKIVVTGEFSVIVRLNADFAADNVVLTVPPDSLSTEAENAARLVTSDFPGMKSGSPYGTQGTGAQELNVQTKSSLSSSTLTIKKL